MIVFLKMNVFNYSAFTAALNHQEVSYGKIQLQLWFQSPMKKKQEVCVMTVSLSHQLR